MFLKQIFAREEKKYASFNNIKFPRGNYQTDSSETKTHHCLYCSPLNFLPLAGSNIGTQGAQELFFVNKKPLEVANSACHPIVKP